MYVRSVQNGVRQMPQGGVQSAVGHSPSLPPLDAPPSAPTALAAPVPAPTPPPLSEQMPSLQAVTDLIDAHMLDGSRIGTLTQMSGGLRREFLTLTARLLDSSALTAHAGARLDMRG